MGNTEMIQLLGATDQLRMNILDSRDRTCMHYAAIKGKQSLINTLFLLFKSSGGNFVRAPIDPDAKENARNPTELEKLNADIARANEEQFEGGSEESQQYSEEPIEDEEIEDEPLDDEAPQSEKEASAREEKKESEKAESNKPESEKV